MNSFFLYMLIFFSSFLYISCGNLFDGITTESETIASTNSNTLSNGCAIQLTGILTSCGAMPGVIADSLSTPLPAAAGQDAKSAAPDISTDTADYSIDISATNGTETCYGNIIPGSVPLSFKISLMPGTWTVKAEGTVTGGQTKITASQTIVLSDGEIPEGLNLKMTAPQTATGIGKVDLLIYCCTNPVSHPTSNVKRATVQCISANAAEWNAYSLLDQTTGELKIYSGATKSGSYEIEIDFYNDAGYLVYNTVQLVNVFDKFSTDKWFAGGSADADVIQNGSFSVGEDLMTNFVQSAFFVDGQNGTKKNNAANPASGTWIKPFDTLAEAIDKIDAFGIKDAKVYIKGRTTESTATIIKNKCHLLTWPGESEAYVTRGSTGYTNEKRMVVIESTGDLTVDGIYFDGNNIGTVQKVTGIVIKNNNGSTPGGKLTLNSGGLINQKSNVVSGVSVCEHAEFIMNGGVIKANSSASGNCCPGVSVDGTFTLKGGSIEGNSGCSAGAVSITNANGIFNMEGGEIKGNKCTENGKGGGIYMTNGTVNFTGGSINGNTASMAGSGIYLAGGTFNMQDSAYVAPDNDFYLADNPGTLCKINIKGEMTNDPDGVTFSAAHPCATITPKDYPATGASRDALSGTDALLKSNYSKFAVTPDSTGKSYYITDNGKIIYSEILGLSAPPTSGTFNFYLKEELLKLSEWSNDATSPATFAGVTFVMQDDIDTTTIPDWKILAACDSDGELIPGHSFDGTLDGNGHTVTISKKAEQGDSAGIAGLNNGTIKNLCVSVSGTLENPSQNMLRYGAVVRTNKGIIRNCKASGSLTVKTHSDLAGIAVYNDNLIENCINETNLTVITYSFWKGEYTSAGGICHSNGDSDLQTSGAGEIRNCINYGIIEAQNVNVDSSNFNGRPGSIFVRQNLNATTENCYWLKDCAKLDISPNTLNTIGIFGTFNGCQKDETKGHITGCGFFTDTTITAGGAEHCKTAQTLQYGTNLLDALNGYVIAHPGNDLKSWEIIDGKVTLKFTD